MESLALETAPGEALSPSWVEETSHHFHAVWINEDAMLLREPLDDPEDESTQLPEVHDEIDIKDEDKYHEEEDDDECSLQNLLSEGNADEQLLCNLCDTWFARLADFRAHLKTHRDPGPFKCGLCERTFLGRTGLLLHGRRAHQNQHRLKCKQCGSQFAFSHTYDEHLRTHGDSKEYKCPDCGKEFRRITEFRRHRRVHTGEKPHHCAHCGRAFSQQTNLQRHMRVHTGEKPFKCSVCDKHFRQSNVLRLHMRLHTGERPYQCPVCEQKFAQRPHRHRHLEKHGIIFIGKDSVEEDAVKKKVPDVETSSTILQPIVLQPNVTAEPNLESKGSAPEVNPVAAAEDTKLPRYKRLSRLTKHLDSPAVNVLMV